jgi:hypothetical protein
MGECPIGLYALVAVFVFAGGRPEGSILTLFSMKELFYEHGISAPR